MIKKCCIILITLLTSVCVCFAGQFKVTRVTDGDTIKVAGDGSNITIRLVGIDAPETSKKKNEPGQPFSQKSTKYLASLVLNKVVDLNSYGTGRYGPILGVVFVNGKNVNLAMVQVGLAEVYRGRQEKGLDLEPYRKAEKEARDVGRGMWIQGDRYVSPKDWRKQQKE